MQDLKNLLSDAGETKIQLKLVEIQKVYFFT